MNQQQIPDLLCQGRVAPYTLHRISSMMSRTVLEYTVAIGRDEHESAIIGHGRTPTKAALNALEKWQEVAP